MMLFLKSRLGRLVSAAIAVLAAVLIIFQAGKQDQRREDYVEDLEDYVKTKEEIHNVEVSPDRDAAIERLRGNGLVR